MKRILSIFLLLGSISAFSQTFDSSFPLKYRNIGPFRGGRSVTATGVVNDPLTYYFGTTGGGLWKTSDAGQHWENISDGYFTTGSVGAVAVSESNPNIIYVGMGEHAPRGVMTSYGDGVYKSTDAGKTWKKLGLEKTQHISRIQIHPTNPDVVYVAAQGALHAPTEDRGIYRSFDGGLTWEKTLFVDNMTGAVELSMDMNFPEILYAAMWEHQRFPWQVKSGGPGSGLYKSTDAGKTWKKIETGLPAEKGKMAVSVSRANSDKVYALIESDTYKDLGGLFVSDNGGESWTLINKSNRLTQRAWYYIEVFADPANEHKVYVQSAPMLVSIDGGKSFEDVDGAHGDYHDLWINPKNPNNMILADDGGGSISFNGGKTWSVQSNMPTAQFYRINVDNQFPYRIYGGQQDNTSVVISSMALGRGGITEEHWNYSAGGESAFLAFDPDDPRYVLGGSYQGTIEVLDMQTQGSTNIMAAPIQYLGMDAKDMKYRFNWNAPIIWSQHEPNTFYHAAQVLLKTSDWGKTWTEVSPDLTRNEKAKQGKGGVPFTNEAVGAENYGTIAYVIESPHEAGVIWTGSDDGLVQLTRDGGKTWTNVTPKGLQECLVNAIDVSPNDPATAYIATTRYKFNDYTPALYKTTDYGKTWTNISKGIPYGAFTRVVREDTEKKDLLFAGTEQGMYLSRDGGATWTSFQLNLPVTPITDLKVAHNDLIVATSGRSYWILDELNIVREVQSKVDKITLYTPEKVLLGNWYSSMNGGNLDGFTGTHPFHGHNPANGMVINYHLPETFADSTELILEVLDSKGNLVRKLSSKSNPDYQSYEGAPAPDPKLSTRKGPNRFVWNLRYPTIPGIPTAYIESSYSGHKAIPGTYTLRLSAGGVSVEAKGEIADIPGYNLTPADYQAYHEWMSSLEAEVTTMHTLVNTAKNYQSQLADLVKKLDQKSEYKDLKNAGETLIKELQTWDEAMVQRRSTAYDDVENFPNKFTANFMFMMNHGESSIPRINEGTKAEYARLMEEWKPLKAEAERLLQTAIPAFNKLATEKGVGVLFVK
ncbi:WD40/YVTN/BNR-like repeat-containing protein [Algoriphagus sanaruensis]|uniref:Glycosyl hydrolase n=1 Tax=Algoriphagus sanaruensis TaxID=1727163 RepID=A0A142EM60_9BACT|nr:glycosyl hydrolase [Algoriphagus sanaruensis]AMQ56215.1 glycosyl hydrolase [Algoriphagus sanaruensis]